MIDWNIGYVIYHSLSHADVVELVDTPDLGSGAARREGSSPFIRTKILSRYE